MVGFTQLRKVFSWFEESQPPSNSELYCQTRDVFEGRLSKLPKAAQNLLKISPNESFLLAAVVGEIGNNSFDHNLGHWENAAGIYFSYEFTEGRGLICIADQGRGIQSSLAAVHPQFSDPQVAINASFEKIISGRYPEKRGNGLKFVRQVVNCDLPRGLWCYSSGAQISFGKLAGDASAQASMVKVKANAPRGTFTTIAWNYYDNQN